MFKSTHPFPFVLHPDKNNEHSSSVSAVVLWLQSLLMHDSKVEEVISEEVDQQLSVPLVPLIKSRHWDGVPLNPVQVVVLSLQLRGLV